jgi:predicted nucleotidyltransferase
LIDSAKQVTQKRAYLYKVTKIGIFGSYLSNQELINDIDIAIVLEPKEKNFEKHEALIWEKVAKAKKRGRKFANFAEELFWPQIEILNYLKSRSRALSLHSISSGGDQRAGGCDRKRL